MDPAYSEDEKGTGTEQNKNNTCRRAGNKRQLNCSLLSLLRMVVVFLQIIWEKEHVKGGGMAIHAS